MSALHPQAVAHVSRHSPKSMVPPPRQRRAVRIVKMKKSLFLRCRADADADDAQDASPPSTYYTLYSSGDGCNGGASTSPSVAASLSSSPPSPSQSRPTPSPLLVNGQPLTMREAERAGLYSHHIYIVYWYTKHLGAHSLFTPTIKPELVCFKPVHDQ